MADTPTECPDQTPPPMCARCTKPAEHVCSGCQHAPDSETTHYCSKECQVAHWPEHKTLCSKLKMRRSLYRAADTLKKLWFAFREETFDDILVRVEQRNEAIYMHENFKGTNHANGPRGLGFLYLFNNALVDNEHDKQAPLSKMRSQECHYYLHNIVLKALEGIYSHVEECYFETKNPPRPVVLIMDYETPEDKYAKKFRTFHTIWKVTLKSGEAFALDMTGAQFGWFDSAMPWIQYLRRVRGPVDYIQRGDPIRSSVGFINNRNLVLCVRDKGYVQSSYVVINIAGHHEAAVKLWELRASESLASIFKKNPTDFQDRQDDLLRTVRTHIRGYIDFQDQSYKAAQDACRAQLHVSVVGLSDFRVFYPNNMPCQGCDSNNHHHMP